MKKVSSVVATVDIQDYTGIPDSKLEKVSEIIESSISEEKKELIDKACKWLKRNLKTTSEDEISSNKYNIITKENLDIIINDFRKAMEK